jgi:hypothetical protein
MIFKSKLSGLAATLFVAASLAFALALLCVGFAQFAGLSFNGLGRDLWVLTLWLFGLCLAPASHVGPALIARYDNDVLRVGPVDVLAVNAAGLWQANQQAAWDQLQHWCFDGAGDGRAPLWQPWAMPRVEQRFSIAVLTGANGVSTSQRVEAFSREIDGSNQLQRAGGAVGRLALRLRVKANDCLWWRARQPTDPWDSGYLIDDAAACKRLRQFLPRRATLMVADTLPSALLRECIAALRARSNDFRHPVRLLIVDAVLHSVAIEPGEARVITMVDPI